MIETLTADIEQYEADAATLGKEISGLQADISTWEGDLNAANKVREIEHTDYVATHKDYSESIKALEMAIATLKKTSGDVKQASAALIQVASSKLFPMEARKVINAFLSLNNENALKMAAPEANAYEFQSQGVVDMLEKLASKFDDERAALEEEETNAVHSFSMLSADLNNQLDAARSAESEKSQAKAKALQGAADSKGALQDTVTTRDDDSKYAADLTATCEQKSTDFANRQELRAEEIEAIQKAIEILAGGAVSGASEKHLPQFVQVKSHSFAQLRSDGQSPNQKKVLAFLKSRAQKLNSRILEAFALRVAA